MSGEGKSESTTPAEHRPSLLPFDPADVMALRILPSQFADMVGVSKQSVSRWIKQGKVSLGPDGRLDPVQACREVLTRTDPARMRVRVFKQAMATHGELRARIEALECQLAESARGVEAARWAAEDAAAVRLARFMDALRDGFSYARDADEAGTLGEWLEELAAVDYYGMDLDEYRADMAGDDGPGPLAPCPEVPTNTSL